MGKLLETAPNPLMKLNVLFKNTFMAGWGKITLENPDIDLIISREPISIIEENGFYTYLSQKECAEHLAPFTRGVLTGAFDTLRKVQRTCTMEIISKDPLKCRYVVTLLVL